MDLTWNRIRFTLKIDEWEPWLSLSELHSKMAHFNSDTIAFSPQLNSKTKQRPIQENHSYVNCMICATDFKTHILVHQWRTSSFGSHIVPACGITGSCNSPTVMTTLCNLKINGVFMILNATMVCQQFKIHPWFTTGFDKRLILINKIQVPGCDESAVP